MKVIVRINYSDFVLDDADGLAILRLLEKAEMYTEKWQPDDQGGSLHYVYPQTPIVSTFRVMSDSLYRMAKLAGKPEE